ncbi:MAG: D-alanine--D-alanine ligase [Phycisphaerae bacterium]
MKTLRITVLAGGPSAEREVSLVSGKAIADALAARGHSVHLADIGPENLAALDRPADVIFPALHGTWGEDGKLQKILEQRGLRFVGCGSRASATAMDKVMTKQVAIDLGIDTAPYEVVTSAANCTLGAPCAVKPVDQGSSVATTMVKKTEDLKAAIEKTIAIFGRALVERFIEGEELAQGVVGGQAMPPVVIRPKREFYDYEAKYHSDDTEYVLDTGYPAPLLERIAADSKRLFEALGCRHLSRVDWIIDRGQKPWLLEINTMPGFTSHSLLPRAAGRAGISFGELCERLVRMALEGAA